MSGAGRHPTGPTQAIRAAYQQPRAQQLENLFDLVRLNSASDNGRVRMPLDELGVLYGGSPAEIRDRMADLEAIGVVRCELHAGREEWFSNPSP